MSKQVQSQNMIVDAHYTFEEALKGTKAPKGIIQHLTLLDVEYYGFDGFLHRGQIMVNKDLSKDMEQIFMFIKNNKFPITKVIPMVKYNWDDDQSMDDNNTSSFNFRPMTGSKKLSLHAYGLAVDINPVQNPYIKDAIVQPKGASYQPLQKGTITNSSPLTLLFKKLGWSWGGDWNTLKDYQHFEKPTN